MCETSAEAERFPPDSERMENARSIAWRTYTDRRKSFTTVFWLHYVGGLAGAHRFYLGLRASACWQLLLGVGSLAAMAISVGVWGPAAAIFIIPFGISGVWIWWDGYNLRDMVRDHNQDLARRLGLDPSETDWWERAQSGHGS